MRLTAVLFLATVIAGCSSQPDASALIGTWRHVKGGDATVVLSLRQDGNFVRTARIAGLDILSLGEYKIEPERIRFFLRREKLAGSPGADRNETITAPYDIEGQSLVLYPGTALEERYLMVR